MGSVSQQFFVRLTCTEDCPFIHASELALPIEEVVRHAHNPNEFMMWLVLFLDVVEQVLTKCCAIVLFFVQLQLHAEL